MVHEILELVSTMLSDRMVDLKLKVSKNFQTKAL